MKATRFAKLVLRSALFIGLLVLAGCSPPETTPIATLSPTVALAPPTATTVPPTLTAVPPTATPIPPTNTAPPPTATSAPPTNTTVPTTPTKAPPAATKPAPATTQAQAPAPSPTPKVVAKPAGRGKILMTSNRESWDDIYVMNENGSGVARLTTMGRCYGAKFSPDGTKIVFYHFDDKLSDIYMMNSDGSDLKNITNSPEKWEDDPDWSPDGQQIVYRFTWVAGGKAAAELYVMNADGSNPHPVLASGPHFTPKWSPDGGRIAFSSLRNSKHKYNYNIYVVNADGSGLTQLTNDNNVHLSPVWSPDSSTLAFSTLTWDPNDPTGWQIWLMGADGNNPHPILTGIGKDPGNSTNVVAWRGDRLLLGGYRGNWDIFFANTSGGDLTPITDHPKDDKPSDWR